VTAVAILAVTAAALPATAGAKKPTITMSGSTSVAPLVAKLAPAYLKACRKCVTFRLAQGGSDIGVSDAARGRVSIGNSSRDPKPTDPGGLVFTKIARDAICVITNPANTVPNLSQDTIKAVFSGTINDWSQVPGSTITGPIDLTVRTPASGTQDAFQKIFMGTAKIDSKAAEKASNGLVQQAVKSDKQAIGYVSLAFTSGTNPAAYNGVGCNLRDAKSGQYGGVRNFWMVTLGDPSGAVSKWISWIRKNSVAAKIIATEWVPLG